MLNKKLHEEKMIDVLHAIYNDKYLSSRLGFKGGTACYFLYNLPRFSVDLDFNVVGDCSGKTVRGIFTKLEEILKKHNRFDEARIKYYTIFFLINYKKGDRNLKIEISKRSNPVDQYEIKNFLGIHVLTMKKPDMFAHKLIALTDRKQIANRDLFDIYWMFKEKWPIREEIIQNILGFTLVDYLKKILFFLEEDVPKKQLLSGLGELIDEKQKYFVNNHLLEELDQQIQKRIYLIKK